MKYAPHPYQKVAISFCVGLACAGLLLSPGLGKTSIIYAVFKLLKRRGLVNKMLVVAPLRPAHSTWPGEREKWDDFHDLKVAVLHGPKKAELLASDADVFVINPEGLQWFSIVTAKMKPWPFEMLVVDESTRFKHSNTMRFKYLKHLLPRFSRRYILTGSPAPNGLIDLFGQIYILDLGNALGQYITHYRANYFDNPDGEGWAWVPRPNADLAIYEKLKPLVLRMDAADLLDMPPLIFNRVDVELPPKAREQYDSMESMLITSVDKGMVTAANAAVASGKCRQIANGGIFHEDGEKWSHIHDAKTEAVVEIVEELSGKPALVAYEFTHDLARLRQAFPDAPFIGGGVPPRRFKEIEAAWNAGKLPVLLAQPTSVAHGLNLQGTGAAIIRHSHLWDLEVIEQFIQRVWRQGQKEKVVVHDVIATGTVDEIVLRGVAKKDRTQRALLDALKDYSKLKKGRKM